MAFIFLQSHRKKPQVLFFSVHALWCHEDLSICPLAVVKVVIYLFGEKKKGLCEIWGIIAIYLLRFPCSIFFTEQCCYLDSVLNILTLFSNFWFCYLFLN